MIDKGLAKSPTTKIYLATPWFNDVQKERAKKAREYLNQNETVGVIHVPFDFQYKDATVDNDPEGVFGTPEWVAATFQNDCTAVATSDIGVFLYDLDNIDDGCAYELALFRSQQKPCVVIPFTERDREDVEINLMIAGAATTWIKQEDFESLKTFNFNHPQANPVPPFKVF